MPIIKSAIKKVRVDQRRRAVNLARQSRLRTVLKKAKAESSFETVSRAYAELDKAVKVKMVHKNYADRKKAQLAKLAKPTKLDVKAKPRAKAAVKPAAKSSSKPVAKTVDKPSVKTAAKKS